MKYLPLDEVARQLGITPREVYTLIRSGQLRGIHAATEPRWRVAVDDLEAYLDARE